MVVNVLSAEKLVYVWKVSRTERCRIVGNQCQQNYKGLGLN